ncbi:MAG: 30S ribosomal protein S6 [Clostridiales bacterium]|nr:30S ribosomal protein S6 [Clostridiales bacterium]
MAKVSGKYESLFIIDASLGDDAIAALVSKFQNLVEQNGTLGEVNEWGKRRLAYPIDHKTEGYYVLMTFTSVPSFPAELTRNYNITDGIIRSMVVEQAE